MRDELDVEITQEVIPAKPDQLPDEIERFRARFTETEEVIFRRRSVRVFKKKQVPDWMVRRILEAGRYAPSAANSQPWKFVVVRDRKMIGEMEDFVVDYCKKFTKMMGYTRPGKQWLKKKLADLFIRLKPNMLHPTPFGALNLIGEGRFAFIHGAPTLIFIFKDKRGVGNPDLDCGIAGQNMVLAAHSLGLGTCWIGFGVLLFDNSKDWCRRLGLEYPYEFGNLLAIGHPKGQPDGIVPRETHPVLWFEDGGSRIHDPSDEPQQVSRSERRRIPDYRDSARSIQGTVTYDYDACQGCSYCIQVCPADTLEMVDKQPRMREPAECIACGDCVAICPEDAITLTRTQRYSDCFKTLNRGPMSPPRLD
jgi:nitroreductase/ferredoxin